MPRESSAGRKRRKYITAEKHHLLLDRYAAGMTFDKIAEELGYANKSNAYRAMQTALRERAKERAELADQQLELIFTRYDRLLDHHMARAVDETLPPIDAARAAGVVLQITDRIVKLLGLDQPQQVQVSVTYDDLDREINELASKVLNSARADGVDLDAPIIESLAAGSPE